MRDVSNPLPIVMQWTKDQILYSVHVFANAVCYHNAVLDKDSSLCSIDPKRAPVCSSICLFISSSHQETMVMPKLKYDHPVIQKGAVQVFAHLVQKPMSPELRKVRRRSDREGVMYAKELV